jgi:hypothetical protein
MEGAKKAICQKQTHWSGISGGGKNMTEIHMLWPLYREILNGAKLLPVEAVGGRGWSSQYIDTWINTDKSGWGRETVLYTQPVG